MSAFCPECMSDHHFVCSRPCNCRCTIDRLIEHTKHDNVLVNTADVRHAPYQYTEYEVRQSNRELRDHLVGRRKYADESLGTTSRWYRFRKAFGKGVTASAVTNTAVMIEQLP